MHFGHAFILGIVEGLTEFLPVSSTGHLILTSSLLGIESTEFLKSFEIAIQLGAILAVVALYGRAVLRQWSIMLKVLIAFLPTAVIGLASYKLVKSFLLGNELVVCWALIIGGLVLILFEKAYSPGGVGVTELKDISLKQAVLIGVAQSLAVIPGVSRSAATIIGGLCLGVDRRAIVEFSFLLAIPTMAAATGLDLLKSAHAFSGEQIGFLATGFITAFVVAMISIKGFLYFIQRYNFIIFGMYRIFIALFFLFHLGFLS